MDLSTPGNPKNILSRKLKINTKTTAMNLMETFCSKLGNSKINLKKKILKVRSLNDYIFDLKEPLINFSYLNECIRLNLMPEYVIIDNPELMDNSNMSNNSSITTNNSMNESTMDSRISLNTTLKRSQNPNRLDIKNIANYNPIICNKNSQVLDKKNLLDKCINNKIKVGHSYSVYMNQNQTKMNMKNKLSNPNKSNSKGLELFIDILETDINIEINEKLKGDIPSKKKRRLYK